MIVPVYNAGKTLRRCIESIILGMEGVRGEIILIDNKSSDDSAEVITGLTKEYPKIVRGLKCETPGASAVRNMGVKQAKGKYIWFVDADDTIAEGAAKKLVQKADKTGADIVMMGAKRVGWVGRKEYLSAVDMNDKDYKSRFIRYGMGPWQVIIRRKWWNENGFKFHEGIIQEDMELMSALILYTDKYASLDEPLYFYHFTSESVLHKSKFDPHVFDIFPALEGLYQRFEMAGAEQVFYSELEWFFIWNLLIDSAKDFASFPEGRDGFKRTRVMMKKYFPGWRKNKFLKEKRLKTRLLVWLNYHRV